MSDGDEIEILCDFPFTTTVTIFCECGEVIDGPDVVLRECPHRNGTRIEHCPKCDAELGVTSGPHTAGDEMPDCGCWSARAAVLTPNPTVITDDEGAKHERR